MKKITVLLAEDHAVVRDGIRSLLATEADIELVGEAETGRQAVQRAKELRPDVIVMDIAMPLLNGLDAARQIREAVPAAKVLFLSAHSDDAYVERAMELGAAGYMLKQAPFLVLAKAIRAAHKGDKFLSSSVEERRRRLEDNSTRGAAGRRKRRLPHLTSREVEVLQLVAEGLANKQIADELSISIKTVEKHRQHLMNKLDIHDTAGLTRYAIAEGIIENAVRLKIE